MMNKRERKANREKTRESNNAAVKEFNITYLKECVDNGTLIGDLYEFSMLGQDGEVGGCDIVYNIKTGETSRITQDRVYQPIRKDESTAEKGYLNFVVYTPYSREVHGEPDDYCNWLNGLVVSRDWRVYEHIIGALISIKLNEIKIDLQDNYNINHKDGCPFHNWIDNLEYCTVAQNNYHAAVLYSLYYYSIDSHKIKIDKNKVKTWNYFEGGISALDVVEYMEINNEFNSAVRQSSRTLKSSKLDNSYIPKRLLLMFMNFI